jgi:hypothetical protein
MPRNTFGSQRITRRWEEFEESPAIEISCIIKRENTIKGGTEGLVGGRQKKRKRLGVRNLTFPKFTPQNILFPLFRGKSKIVK